VPNNIKTHYRHIVKHKFCTFLILYITLGGLGVCASFLADQGLVDVRDHAAASDRCFNETVQLLVSSDCQLQVTRRDTFHFKILRRIACQFQHLGGEVLQDSSGVDGRGGPHASVAGGTVLQVSVYPPYGEL